MRKATDERYTFASGGAVNGRIPPGAVFERCAMETIQIAIGNTPYASALKELLTRNGSWDVRCVENPDMDCAGVLVLDAEQLDRLAIPLDNPERIVLITKNDPRALSRAWEAGVNSVVFDKDPLNTTVLAVMSARLRNQKKN